MFATSGFRVLNGVIFPANEKSVRGLATVRVAKIQGFSMSFHDQTAISTNEPELAP